MFLAQRTQRSDACEARTRGPSVSSQALFHWATALPKNTERQDFHQKYVYKYLKQQSTPSYYWTQLEIIHCTLKYLNPDNYQVQQSPFSAMFGVHRNGMC